MNTATHYIRLVACFVYRSNEPSKVIALSGMYDRPNLPSVSRHTHRQVAHVLPPAAAAPLTEGPAVETASRDTPPLDTNNLEVSSPPTGAPADAPSASPVADQEVCTPFIVATTVHSVAPSFHCTRRSLVATKTKLAGAEKQC